MNLEEVLVDLNMQNKFPKLIAEHGLQESIDAILGMRDWQYRGTNFSAKLFALLAHADTSNLRKLAKGFPVEADAYTLYAMGKLLKDF